MPENRENDTQAGKLAKVISDMTPYIEEKISSMDVPGYDRDDLRQEALIALFSAVETYRPDGGASFSTYAVSCINNRLTDAARKASAQGNRPLNESEQLEEEAEEADAAPSPEDMAALREELRRALEDMREKLSAFECRVMTLWLQGYSAGEIGQMTGKSPRSVSNALDRARRKLRNEMNG